MRCCDLDDCGVQDNPLQCTKNGVLYASGRGIKVVWTPGMR